MSTRLLAHHATSSRQNNLRVRAMHARVDRSGPRITSKHHVGTKPSSKQAKGALQGSGWWVDSYCVPTARNHEPQLEEALL